MKTFKTYISEHSGDHQQQYQDQDVSPTSGVAIEALNSYVGSIGSLEFMNPRIGVARIQENLSKLGYSFEMPKVGAEGEYSLPLTYKGGTFEADRSENPYGEFKHGDGISEHIPGGLNLVINVHPSGNGKSHVSAELVQNMG